MGAETARGLVARGRSSQGGSTVKVFAEVWGGYSYAWGDREAYESTAEVLADLRCETDREYGSRYARPCWGDWAPGDYCALIYAAADADYPAKVVEVGPRGGLLVREA